MTTVPLHVHGHHCHPEDRLQQAREGIGALVQEVLVVAAMIE